MSIVPPPAHVPAELPPTGSARIDRDRVDALAARVTVVAPRETMDVEKPFTGEMLGRVPPDGHTPCSALWALEVLEQAGVPCGLIQVATGSGAKLGPHLIDRVDYVMFTGSKHTGRTVARQAADRLIACSMELGGKNAMIVLQDADIAKAVAGAERALFANAGQLCIAIERLYVHEAIADEYVARLVEHTRRNAGGAELDSARTWAR